MAFACFVLRCTIVVWVGVVRYTFDVQGIILSHGTVFLFDYFNVSLVALWYEVSTKEYSLHNGTQRAAGTVPKEQDPHGGTPLGGV